MSVQHIGQQADEVLAELDTIIGGGMVHVPMPTRHRPHILPIGEAQILRGDIIKARNVLRKTVLTAARAVGALDLPTPDDVADRAARRPSRRERRALQQAEV